MNGNNARISLTNERQHRIFKSALDSCVKDIGYLRDVERQFVTQMKDGYDLVGEQMTITVKQLNWLTQIAWDLES